MSKQIFTGCLLGCAIGDALGLPYEGLSPRRAVRLFPDSEQHHLFRGQGMFSDDTEHLCFTAMALLKAKGDQEVFQKRLARSLRWWLTGLPAGIGFATLRAILRLWAGFSPQRSGVFSAGNGPAMRTPIIGLVYGGSHEELKNFVRRTTQITHSDPKAYYGALAVALAAYQSAFLDTLSGSQFLQTLGNLLADEDADQFLDLIHQAVQSAQKGEPTSVFAEQIGSSNGISGYIYHTVPCVLQTWLRYPDDYRAGIQEIIKAGGDTDTTAAILGAIIGARVGVTGIPTAWIDKIMEWPRSIAWIKALGHALEKQDQCPSYFVPGVILRNAFFLILILAHGFRRMAPPY